MKVYIARYSDNRHENGGSILGIFETYESAEKTIDKKKKREFHILTEIDEVVAKIDPDDIKKVGDYLYSIEGHGWWIDEKEVQK